MLDSMSRRKRIAIIIPVGYRGGSLRGAKLLAKAAYLGSRQFDEPVDVVFVHLDDDEVYQDKEFFDLYEGVSRRDYNWEFISSTDAKVAMRYAGFENWEASYGTYLVPNDGINYLNDCDLWVVVSDRMECQLLPLKPVVLMVYDYLQRYESILDIGQDQPFIDAARCAEKVLVTTEFTRNDALQYAGVAPMNVKKLPMLAPEFDNNDTSDGGIGEYFVWTTNAAPHKNHIKALEALRIYYEELDGRLKCIVTGVNTSILPCSDLPHLSGIADALGKSLLLNDSIEWAGELNDKEYRSKLAASAFLWHAGRIDNGTFSVIEAASMGVPSLSSDYPAMREIDAQFSLNMMFMNSDDPIDMADKLKSLENDHRLRREQLPSGEQFTAQNVENLASSYWEVLRECL